jgi:hypothetical protein
MAIRSCPRFLRPLLSFRTAGFPVRLETSLVMLRPSATVSGCFRAAAYHIMFHEPGQSPRRNFRRETTLPIKWIAARVQIGTFKGATSVLYHWMHTPDKTVTDTATTTTGSCAQLQFESTAGAVSPSNIKKSTN